ncbi:MAG: PorP/SprF family type IX secretion system membrane protein [Flavobacteriales bacterium]|nr:PorP/SprF family type IX secretion system membrane protein [Flavobacteriales bacterium]
MKKLIHTFFVIGLGLISFYSFSQDSHFSQFNALPLQLNPATAGENAKGFRIGTTYRNQWGPLNNGYRTVVAHGDMCIPSKRTDVKERWGVGFSILKDKSGEIGYGILSATGSGAYHLPVARHQMVSFGMSAGVTQTSLDPKDMRWGNQYDGEKYNRDINGEPFRFENKMFGDIGAGIQYTYFIDDQTMTSKDARTIKAGAAISHVTRPKVNAANDNNSRLQVKYNGYFSADLGIKNTDVSIHPTGYFTKQGQAREVLIGCAFRYALKESSRYTGYVKSSGVGFGFHARMGDAVIPSIFFETAGLSVGISYDIATSAVRKAAPLLGGPEISLRFRVLG